MSNPWAQLAWDRSVDEHLSSPLVVDPLRKGDCPPITDGACAVILAADDRARELRDRPAWIRGIGHQIEPMALGVRDLTTSVSTAGAAERAGADGTYDVVEVHAPDSIGVLHRITSAIAEFRLDIVRARVQTLLDEVVDSFYVEAAGGGKVPEDVLPELRRAVLHAVEPPR